MNSLLDAAVRTEKRRKRRREGEKMQIVEKLQDIIGILTSYL